MLFTPIFTAFLRGMRERIIVFSWAAAGGISPVFSNVPRVPFTAFFLERLSPFCSSAMFSSRPRSIIFQAGKLFARERISRPKMQRLFRFRPGGTG